MNIYLLTPDLGNPGNYSGITVDNYCLAGRFVNGDFTQSIGSTGGEEFDLAAVFVPYDSPMTLAYKSVGQSGIYVVPSLVTEYTQGAQPEQRQVSMGNVLDLFRAELFPNAEISFNTISTVLPVLLFQSQTRPNVYANSFWHCTVNPRLRR